MGNDKALKNNYNQSRIKVNQLINYERRKGL